MQKTIKSDPATFALKPASSHEVGFFYAQSPEQDAVLGVIGHVRIDFGQSGKEFWYTWHPRGAEELNSPEFKEDPTQLMDELRQSVLRQREAARIYGCGGISTVHPGGTAIPLDVRLPLRDIDGRSQPPQRGRRYPV